MRTLTSITYLLSILMAVFIADFSHGQYCDSLVPTFNADLSASPNMTWTSPGIQRDGSCCGSVDPDVCLEFVITLHPDVIAVNFQIASGAIPPGAMFYQIDCGPPTPVGSPICLSGVGPHHLTFCKPGNNNNTFTVTSYSEPIIGPDVTLNSGCQGFIYANYYNEPSMTWTSIAPGPQGAYDGLLSCTSGCDTTYISVPANPPTYIDYLVCGSDIAGCNPNPICDTIRVNLIPPVTVDVNPDSTHLCFGDPDVTLTANPSGGTAPFSYLWNTGATTQSILGNNGTYYVDVTDASGCLVASDTAVVVRDPLPILADAGSDVTVCQQSPGVINLNGSVQMASGGVWFGGNGTYSPDNTTMSITYAPTAAEINSGSLTISLSTTGNNGCPADTDDVVINFEPFTNNISLSTVDVTCNGANDGSATVNVAGIYTPCTYSWDFGPVSGNNSSSNLSPGVHQVMLINSMGCDTTLFFTINEPQPLQANLDDQGNNPCFNDALGWAQASAVGGTPPYTYSWNSVPVQDNPLATNLQAATYTCVITDINGCMDSVNATITQPTPLTLSLSGVSPDCYGNSTGAVSSSVGGGTPLYNYQWLNGPTSSNQYNLSSGTYTLTVTDNNGCQITDSITLVDPPLLTGSITADTVICPGGNADLSVIGNGGTGNYSYLWTPNNEITSSINVSPANDTQYDCTITDDNGCQTTLSTTIDVNWLNPADLVASVNDEIVCELDTIWLSAAYVGSDPTVTMQWLHCPGCSTTLPLMETPSTSTEYILSGTNACGQTIYDTIGVYVNPTPNLQIGLSSNSACPNEDIYFTNIGDNDPSWSYLWSYGDGNLGNTMNAVHAYSNSGSYPVSLTVTDNNGCTASLNNTDTVTVNPQAVADFDASYFYGSMLEPEIEFYNNSMNASSFNWDFGDGGSSNLAHPVHTFQSAGAYSITLYAMNQYGCNDSVVKGIFLEPAFELYVPNAFTPDFDDYNGIFLPKGFGISSQGYELMVFNRWGDLVFKTNDLNHGWNGTINAGKIKSQDGTYTWVIKFRDEAGRRHERKGHVSLLK